MSPSPSLERDSLILIHAPVGRDGQLLHDLFHRAKLQSIVCSSIDQLCREIELGVGALFIAEEALQSHAVERLSEVLQKQSAWSDLPLVVLTVGGEPTVASRERLSSLEPLGDLTLLERPLRSDTIVSAAHTAVRARLKQYEIRRRDAELQLVTDNVPVLISYIDAEQVYRRVNRTYFEWFGQPPEAIVGRTIEAVGGEPHYSNAQPYIARVLAGERVSFESQIWDKDRQPRYVSVSYAPDVAPTGAVRGFVALVQDITERKWSERRNAFLVQLDDATRPLTDPAAITQSAARLLGEWLDVNRCAYADVEEDEDTFNLTGDYNRGVPSIVGRYKFAQFGEECLRLMRAGQPYVVEDSEIDSRVTDVRESYRSTLIRSVICVSLQKQGRFVAAMAVHQVTPRRWQPDEIELVQQVANRCWESIERARVVRELQSSEQQFRTLANTIPNLAWMAYPDGHIFWYNQRWYSYTGSTAEAMAGWGWQSVHHPEVLPKVMERWNRSLESGEPFEMVFPLKGVEGVFREFLTRVEPVRDARGAVLRWFGTNTDIAAQKRAENALREGQQQLRIALETAKLGSWSLDLEANSLECSPQCYENFGLTEGDAFTYQILLEMIHPDDRPRMQQAVEDAIRDRADYNAEYRIIRPDGITGWIVASGRALYTENGEPYRMVGVTLDISERKRAEEELRRSNDELTKANKYLEEFAYVASHDLQEPLRMVNSYSQLLVKRLGPQESADLQKYVNYIRTGVRRMEDLIRDLLTYSRTAYADEDTPAHAADLNSALKQALDLVDSRMHDSQAVVTAESLPIVAGDEGQLSHVFQNLLSNALKYRNPNAPPRIHIGAQRRNSHWVISVSDNGIGFEQDQAERIFGLFKRLHRDDEYPGTGLGLAICKRIVERYHGRMWAESKEGVGSTFFFSLPGVFS